MNSLSFLLFSRPSFLEGIARTLDLGDTFTEYNSGIAPEQADALALAADWRAVGGDMRVALAQFARRHEAALLAAGRGAAESNGHEEAAPTGTAGASAAGR